MPSVVPSQQSNFNPRTPVGCDALRKVKWCIYRIFQSTHPSGVRPPSEVMMTIALLISIHAPQWGATQPEAEPSPVDVFQSTHPSGVRLSRRRSTCASKSFQSTHPSGVRRGTTPSRSDDCGFQSTHPSGVRRSIHRPGNSSTDFNPRTPVGCDDQFLPLRHRRRISIHAPQWGATEGRTFRFSEIKPFQSTHPSGVRPSQAMYYRGVSKISIHAPQWGATARLSSLGLRVLDFNPRTPVGCDDGLDFFLGHVHISIHAPQWGATGSRQGTIP